MARVKNGAVTKARHKKVLKAAKGYFGSKHRLYKSAKEQLMHSGQYAFRDRKQKKRDFRKLCQQSEEPTKDMTRQNFNYHWSSARGQLILDYVEYFKSLISKYVRQ